ncbi:MAG: anaerobic ribonucleoside-triphosphate reductase, partial [Candidatus Hermodarchaeota archaeon]
DECLNIFKAFIEVFSQIQYNGIPQKWPLHRIYFKNEWLEQYRELYKQIYEKISTNYNPILVNTSTEFYKSKLALLVSKNYINHGILQKISLNLPRIAYLAPHEDSFMELLIERLNLCFNILNKKYNIIQKRISTRHLPFCSAKINDHFLYNIKLQDLSVGVVGLNEAVKLLTNYELHESDDALNVGKHIISEIHNICIKRSKSEDISYSLIEDSSNTATKRFVRLDLKHFPKMVDFTKKEAEQQIVYSNSTHFNKDSILPITDLLKSQGEFHKLIKNGAHEHVNLKQESFELNTAEKFLKVLDFANLTTSINNIRFYI